MERTIHGTVHGKIIELREEVGLIEGQEVEVTVRPIQTSSVRQPGEGFLRTEGALADDTEWDGIMEEIYRARKIERRSQVPPMEEP